MFRTSAIAVVVSTLVIVRAAAAAKGGVVQVRDSGAYPGYYVAGTHSESLRARTRPNGDFNWLDTGAFGLETNDGEGWQPVTTYCLEPNQGIKFGTYPRDEIGWPYTYTTMGDYAPITPAEEEFLGVLWANAFQDSLLSAKAAAAFQALVWEVAIDDDLDLTSGGFKLKRRDRFTRRASRIAEQWMSNVYDQTWTDSASLIVLENPCSQDYLTPCVPTAPTAPPVAVPTPTAWAAGSLCLLVLLAARRRRVAASGGIR